jgi:hypothetical protein
MRNRFTRGLCVLAASAAITVPLGFAAAGAASASPGPHIRNATLVCGPACTDVSSLLLGPNKIVNAHGGATGTNMNLREGGNTRVNEDFKLVDAGTVLSLCTATVISAASYTCVHYGVAGSLVHAWELELAPGGTTDGLCLGVASASVAQRVSLQTCGTVKTFFVGDTLNGTAGGTALAPSCTVDGHSDSCPLLAASDTFTTNPLVLTVNANSKHPVNVLRVDREILSNGDVPDLQMFTSAAGPWFHS